MIRRSSLGALVASLSLLAACGGGGGGASSSVVTTYTVTYDANGATSGTVPVDSNHYTQGQIATVLGNTGTLVKTGYSFTTWNTQASGSGQSYAQGQAYAIGSANVTLYAQWVAARADDQAYMLDSAGGFGVVDLATGMYTPITTSGVQLSAGLGEAQGSLFGGMSNSSQLYLVGTSTGSATTVGGGSSPIQFVGGLGSTTSGLYALDFNETLLSVDPTTGASTAIGPTGLSRVVSQYTLSTGSSSLYYAFNYNLYKLDTANGAPALIGRLGTYNGFNIQFFAMVEVGGTLYGVDSNDRIFTVDTGSGLATFKVQIAGASSPTTPWGNTIYGLAPYPVR